MAIFGRQVRDGLPVLPGHYNPHNTWRELLDHREHAMARRHIAGREQWGAHTKSLAKLVQGDNVFLQNLVGNHPRRWERTGKVVECKEYDQYLVKVDGTGRATLRNRKHLRKFQPIPKHPRLPTMLPGLPTTSATPGRVSPTPALPPPGPMSTPPQTEMPMPPRPVQLQPDILQPPELSQDVPHNAPEPTPDMPRVQGSLPQTPPPGQGHLAAPDPPTMLAAPSPVQSSRP